MYIVVCTSNVWTLLVQVQYLCFPKILFLVCVCVKSREQVVSLSQSFCVSLGSILLTGEVAGEEPKHTTSRKPGPLLNHSILNPDPHQFADVKPKCMEYEPILALFQGFEPFF